MLGGVCWGAAKSNAGSGPWTAGSVGSAGLRPTRPAPLRRATETGHWDHSNDGPGPLAGHLNIDQVRSRWSIEVPSSNSGIRLKSGHADPVLVRADA